MDNTLTDTDVLIVGYGDLGHELAKQLHSAGLSITGLRRSNVVLPQALPSAGITLLQADVTQPHTLYQIPRLNPRIIVYCVAANVQTEDSYRACYVDGLRNVLHAAQHAVDLRHVFFVSSTRVYGQETDVPLDETIPAIPADFGGERLLEAELLLKTLSCRTTVLRLSGIYGPGRTRLIKLAQQPHAWPLYNAWTNRIHRDDAARFIECLIRRTLKQDPVDDCYLVTDDRPTPQYEVLMWIAEQLSVDTGQIKVPQPNGGKVLSNRCMHNFGFSMDYPDYRVGYSRLLHNDI